MKNKLFKIIISILCFTFVIFGSVFTGKAGQKSSASALSFSQTQNDESLGESEENIITTPFLVDPSLLIVSSSKESEEESEKEFLFVFDQFDSSLKVVQKDSGKFRSKNTSYQTKFTPTDMISIEGLILLLDAKNSQIDCVSKDDFTSFSIEETFKEKLFSASKILTLRLGGTDHVLLCPSTLTESKTGSSQNKFELLSFEKDEESEEKTLKIKNSSSFLISSDFEASVEDYDHIYACENNDKLFIMIIKSNSIVCVEFDPELPTTSITTIQSPSASSDRFSTSEIKDFCEISLEDGKILAIELENKVELYSLSVSSSEISMKHISDHDISFEEGFDISCLCAFDSTLAVLSSEKQEIRTYSFSGTLSDFEKTENKIQNQKVEVELWNDLGKFVFVKATEDLKLFETPFSKTEKVTVKQDETMVIIGEGKLSETVSISGFAFVLFTASDTNFYGFVKQESISELEKSVHSSERVTVLTNTALLKYPSFVRPDEHNQQIGELLSSTANVKVDMSETGLHAFSCQGTKFLRVVVTDDDGTTREGFIDSSRARDWKTKENRVVTNATIKRNNSEIFTEEDSKSDIITLLDKGARVKIVGKRNTKTNLTKITFNDKAGNSHTGYVYTYNLETDTWSMLQIIGMALIIVNTILLVVIICVKNKVTK